MLCQLQAIQPGLVCVHAAQLCVRCCVFGVGAGSDSKHYISVSGVNSTDLATHSSVGIFSLKNLKSSVQENDSRDICRSEMMSPGHHVHRMCTKLSVSKELAFHKMSSILLLWIWVPGLGWA